MDDRATIDWELVIVARSRAHVQKYRSILARMTRKWRDREENSQTFHNLTIDNGNSCLDRKSEFIKDNFTHNYCEHSHPFLRYLQGNNLLDVSVIQPLDVFLLLLHLNFKKNEAFFKDSVKIRN